MTKCLEQTLRGIYQTSFRAELFAGGAKVDITTIEPFSTGVLSKEFPDNRLALNFNARVSGPKPGIWSPEKLLGNWYMTKGFHPRKGDVFATLMSRASRQHFYLSTYNRISNEPCLDDDHLVTPLVRDTATQDLKQLYRHLNEVTNHLVLNCSPIQRKAAMRFSAPIRFRIYRELMADPTGRLMQLSYSVPGLLLFAMALRERGRLSGKIANQILRDVISGKQLPHILDEAVDAWIKSAPDILKKSHCDGTGENLPWEQVNCAGTLELNRIRTAQKYLIRAAGPMVPPTLVWLPPPVWICPEDVPRKVLENARWFKVMKSSHKLISTEEGTRGLIRIGFASALSKNHQVMVHWKGRRLKASTAGNKISQAYDYLDAESQIPTRKSNVVKIFEASEQWHKRIQEVRTLNDLRAQLNGKFHTDEHTPFPVCVLPTRSLGFEINRIGNALELIDEGRQMKHCVASRISNAISGNYTYASALIAGRRLTLEIEIRYSGPNEIIGVVLKEVKGKANRSPLPEEMMALREWLKLERLQRNSGTGLEKTAVPYCSPPPPALPAWSYVKVPIEGKLHCYNVIRAALE